MWEAAFLWYFAVQAIGLAAFPLVARACDRLPDRGWTLSKPLGLLIVAYAGWLIGHTGVLAVSRWTVLPGVLLLVGLSLLAMRGRTRPMLALVRSRAGVIAGSEILFAAVFFAMVLLRGWLSVIEHTEQPMDLMMLNAVIVSTEYPPADAWLAGQPVSYYYFGYLLIGTVALLTGIATAVAFNLGLALSAAMAAIVVFGVTFNLVRLAWGSTFGAMLAGACAAYFLLIASNAAGILELPRAAGMGDAEFWGSLGLNRLNNVEPDWWWWQASRTVSGAITEFPYFSFLLGDLHPHVMSIPYVLAVFALAIQLSRETALLRWPALLRRWPLALAIVLTVGVLGPLNLWDLALGAALIAGGLFLNATSALSVARPVPAGGERWPPLLRGHRWWIVPVGWRVGAFVVLVLGALLAFGPFYLHVDSNTQGIRPLPQMGTRPVQLMLMWGAFGLLLVPTLALTVAALLPRRLRDLVPLGVALAVAFMPILAWAVLGWLGLPGGEGDPPFEEGANIAAKSWPAIFTLALVTAVSLYGAYAAARSLHPVRRALGPVLLAFALIAMLLVGVDFFYVDDFFTDASRRLNSVFKVYYQVWLFAAVLAGFSAWYLTSRWRLARPLGQAGASLSVALLALAVVVTAYYPAVALGSRVSEGGGLTLDGLAYLEESSPAEAQAIAWIRDNTPRSAVVVETAFTPCSGLPACSDFTSVGRISASTGRPTLLGWYNHERQWRSNMQVIADRVDAVNRIYGSSDMAMVRDVLALYDVDYVVFGPRERQMYGAGAADKFAEAAEAVFRAGGGDDELVIFDVSGLRGAKDGVQAG